MMRSDTIPMSSATSSVAFRGSTIAGRASTAFRGTTDGQELRKFHHRMEDSPPHPIRTREGAYAALVGGWMQYSAAVAARDRKFVLLVKRPGCCQTAN
jgi:hypothetical protein